MMPVYESMNGAGQLNTSKITVNDLNTLLQIAEALKFNTLKKLELDKIGVKFQFIDGKMMVKPFDIHYKNIKANIEGWTNFNQSIAYVMRLDIPRKELGNSANQLMENLLSEANKLGGNFSLPETISFDVLIGGTLSKPTVKTGLASGGNNLIEKAKEEVIKEISKEVQEKAQQILDEADKQAKAIIAEAEKQAKSLRKNADKAIADLNAETDKQAKKLMTEAKKQGLLAELAAGEAVKQLRKETDKQVQKLSTEADKQAGSIIKTAKQTAKKIKAEAKKKSDKLLEQ
jgi:vacuolar-type H+-ATPase subunit H